MHFLFASLIFSKIFISPLPISLLSASIKNKITSELEDINNESMIIYSILDGAGKLEWGTDYKECLQIHKGESLLVPVNVKVKLNGNIEILRTTI